MTGCLAQKNGRYHMVISIYEGDKRKQRWISTGLPVQGNRRKAEQMLRHTLVEMEKLPELNPLQADRCNNLFSAYIRYWLAFAKRKVDKVTYQGYDILAQTHVLPYFDALGVKLKDVMPDILQIYVDEKSAHGRKDGKGGLSPRSVQMHKNILHQSLELAVKEGLLPCNPCKRIILPPSERYEPKFYTADDLNTLFDRIREDDLYPLIKITALYGLRRSEVLGLQWDSVDFYRKLITIRRTVSKVTEVVEKNKTKTASSYRSFPLLPEAESIFLSLKAQQEENRRLFGRTYHESDYVFTWPDGHLYRPDYITARFSDLLKKHGLPYIRFHELRHSCASLLLNEGCTLKDVQEWMGHADIQMTANIYGHLDVARKQGIANKIGTALAVKSQTDPTQVVDVC